MRRFFLLVAVLMGVGATQGAIAAPILGGAVALARPPVTEVYYYHGRYYPYYNRGHYYHHRYYRHGRPYYY